MDIGQLKQKMSLPLEAKEILSIMAVENFLKDYDAYISLAGVDSRVIDHLLTSNGIKLERVSISMAEPKYNNQLNAKLGTTFLPVKRTKKDIIQSYGYPIISKQISMIISRYTKAFERGDQEVMNSRLYGDGRGNAGVLPLKYRPLIYAPFYMTEKCCSIIKKNPLDKYGKLTGKYPITGERAVESDNRMKEYLKHGCIMNNKKRIKCTPLGFWTDKDILDYIIKHDVEISKEYGSVVKKDQQSLFDDYKFSGEQRTGCDICLFGILYDLTRFERMKNNKPLTWQTMMNGGEFIEINDYREVRFEPNGEIELSNKIWVPNKKGFGYRFVIEWINKALNETIKI